jgi:hypothetical protein
VALITALPDANPYKTWLLLAAPTLTVGISVTFAFCGRQLSEYGKRRRVRDALGKVKEALGNPLTSDAHKAKMKAAMEALEAHEITNALSDLVNLAPATHALAPPDAANPVERELASNRTPTQRA